MKKKLLLLLGGIVLFVFILVTSFAWSKIFYDGGSSSTGVPTLYLKLTNQKNQVDTTQDYPSETPNDEMEPYRFSISNQSKQDGKYQLLLEEEPVSNQVGYRQEDLLTRKQLNYQLTLNHVVIKEGRLSSLKNNVLDERILQGNQENNYILRIWVHDEVKAGEWENKYYHYKVTLKA